MRSIFNLIIVAALPGITFADDYVWFEADWISNAATTVDANPEVRKLDPEARKGFESLFGLTRWHVANGILTISHPGTEDQSSPYSVKPIDPDQFEILIGNDDFETTFTITKTEEGFCTTPHPTWVPEYRTWTKPWVECFVNNDA